VHTYTVALAFDVNTTDYDPGRLARMAEHFAALLPQGSRTLTAGAAVDGVATVSAYLPAEAPARALHAVATALELAASREPAGLDSLGELRRAVVELQP
jgi:hypothetical protein